MKDYKKILEGVVDIINNTEKSDIGFANICTYIGENCPELKESEDEKIKNEIINFIKDNTLTYTNRGSEIQMKWIAWLEKQGQTFTKKDVDDAYLKGVCDAKQEIEKQGEQNLNPCDGCINRKGCINCENGELREVESVTYGGKHAY